MLGYCREIGSPNAVPDAKMLGAAPLILISQLSRSGGSLFSQLLDAHPELHVFPYELTIGFPTKIRWPELDPDQDPETLFAGLFDPHLGSFSANGYRKLGRLKDIPWRHRRLTFKYAPEQHYLLFSAALPSPPRNRRQVLDAYLSSFFGSWQRETMTDSPRNIAGFVPGLASRRKSVQDFFEDYPDGRLVSIVRNPSDWLVSRCAHVKTGVADDVFLEKELRSWNKMARHALQYAKLFPKRVFLIRFEDLVKKREFVMRSFADWAGIEFKDILLEQTFDGHSIGPNTNFQNSPEQLAIATINRYRELSWAERVKVFVATWRAQWRLKAHF